MQRGFRENKPPIYLEWENLSTLLSGSGSENARQPDGVVLPHSVANLRVYDSHDEQVLIGSLVFRTQANNLVEFWQCPLFCKALRFLFFHQKSLPYIELVMPKLYHHRDRLPNLSITHPFPRHSEKRQEPRTTRRPAGLTPKSECRHDEGERLIYSIT